MRKQIWVLAFLAALLADIAGILAGNEWVQWISKPLILPFLFLYFYSEINAVSSPLNKWIYLALFFSWAGDVLLMFQGMKDLFFLLGLAALILL